MNDNQLSTYQKIWRTVQAVRQGKVASYGQIADLAGLPGRARLVGKCLGYVPSEGFRQQTVPWYRVLRSDGSIAFPIGSDHFERQRNTLMDEGVLVKNRRVHLKTYQWQPDLTELLALDPENAFS